MNRLIVPREHGAWAMLLIPFLAGLGVNGFSLNVQVLLTAGAVLSLFLARYPLTLLVKYPQRRHSFLPSLYVYLLTGILFGIPLIAYFRMYLLVPVGVLAVAFLAINLVLTARGKERSIAANLLGITGLALNGVAAYYVSGGNLLSNMLLIWIACSLFFASSLFYVKMLFRESKTRYFRELALMVHLFALIIVLVGVWLKLVPALLPLAFVPSLAKVLFAMRQAGKPNLRKIGFIELAYSLAFLLLVLVSFSFPVG